jgi:hypothetical protein
LILQSQQESSKSKSTSKAADKSVRPTQNEVAPPRFVTELFSYTLIRGKVERTGTGGASIYLSANFAASSKISTNIFRVSFPVCVFWFDGWYDASNTLPSGIR